MKIEQDVMQVLTRLEIEGPFVKIAQQLDRKLYTRVNKVLEALGGEWDRRAKAHVFEGDASARIEHAIVTGEVTTDQDLGFFPTPSELARQLVALADVRPGHIVLEPSAGDGAIVDKIQAAGAYCFAIERDRNRRNSLIHGWTRAVQVHRSCDDFMAFEPDEPFDRVVMNPPFLKVGAGDHLDHVRHAFGMLASRGVLVSVLPEGVRFREDRKHVEFRQWIVESSVPSGGWGLAALPDNSFKASGTGVRTCTLRMVKP